MALSNVQPHKNWARYATVEANRSYLESRPEQAINGVRHTNNNWAPHAVGGGSGGWDSGADTDPAILIVDFGMLRTFSHIKMYTLRDVFDYAVDPTTAEGTTLYGITSYTIDYWDGDDWVNFISETNSFLVVREHNFVPITSTKIRFSALGTADHVSIPQARLVELEVWSDDPLNFPFGKLEAKQRRIRDQQWPNGLPEPHEGATTVTVNGGPSAAWALGGDSDLLTFNVYPGLTLNGYVYRPVATPPVGGVERDGWIICILGHETVASGINRVQYFVDRGFKTILLGMPNNEPNASSWNYTHSTLGTVAINDSNHTQYDDIIEADGTKLLPLFLDQVFRAANWIRQQEPGAIIHLTGHSGGGFMTSMAAIMDERQLFTVKNSNAGEMPFALDDTVVHVEQDENRPWWFGEDWDDLYPIAARFGKFTKSHGEGDPAFGAAERHHVFREIVDNVNAELTGYTGDFDIYIDEAAVAHTYSDDMLQLFVDDCLLFE